MLAVLDAWAGACPPDKPALAVAESASSGKATPDGKIAALRWLAALAADGKLGGAAGGLQKAVSAGAADRNAEVREAAAALSFALSQQVSCDTCFALGTAERAGDCDVKCEWEISRTAG